MYEFLALDSIFYLLSKVSHNSVPGTLLPGTLLPESGNGRNLQGTARDDGGRKSYLPCFVNECIEIVIGSEMVEDGNVELSADGTHLK